LGDPAGKKKVVKKRNDCIRRGLRENTTETGQITVSMTYTRELFQINRGSWKGASSRRPFNFPGGEALSAAKRGGKMKRRPKGAQGGQEGWGHGKRIQIKGKIGQKVPRAGKNMLLNPLWWEEQYRRHHRIWWNKESRWVLGGLTERVSKKQEGSVGGLIRKKFEPRGKSMGTQSNGLGGGEDLQILKDPLPNGRVLTRRLLRTAGVSKGTNSEVSSK